MKKQISGIADLEEIQRRLNFTYLNGVYLGINALRDAYLLLDGPPCGYNKLYFIHKTHDLFSDLSRRDSNHRICCTEVRVDRLVHERDRLISQLLLRVSRRKDCGVVFVCSMPVATLTGVQYDLIINRASRKTKTPLIEIPSRSLQSDWLGGYEETLLAIAGNIPLKSRAARKGNVAIVGYLFDRNEGDHLGNLAELERIFKNLSLKLVSVWLSGCSFGELGSIEKAATIISLPYARSAARQIARRTGADLIELDLPLGIGNTADWINAIAARLKRKKEARLFIDKELQELIPIANLVVPGYLLGKKFMFFGDPYLAGAVTSALCESGGQTERAVIFGRKNSDDGTTAPFKRTWEPSYGEAFRLDTAGTDIFIGNAQIGSLLNLKNDQKPFIEFGYPSFNYHCLRMAPFLGFKGYINFLNRIVNSQGGGYGQGR
jgi:nitrogenase molybdenum-iron protein alpha/beta subunit